MNIQCLLNNVFFSHHHNNVKPLNSLKAVSVETLELTFFCCWVLRVIKLKLPMWNNLAKIALFSPKLFHSKPSLRFNLFFLFSIKLFCSRVEVEPATHFIKNVSFFYVFKIIGIKSSYPPNLSSTLKVRAKRIQRVWLNNFQHKMLK